MVVRAMNHRTVITTATIGSEEAVTKREDVRCTKCIHRHWCSQTVLVGGVQYVISSCSLGEGTRKDSNKMEITDNRENTKEWFKNLLIGDVFEYHESFYIKTSISEGEVNAVDLMKGSFETIQLYAEVDALDAELIVSHKGARIVSQKGAK